MLSASLMPKITSPADKLGIGPEIGTPPKKKKKGHQNAALQTSTWQCQNMCVGSNRCISCVGLNAAYLHRSVFPSVIISHQSPIMNCLSSIINPPIPSIHLSIYLSIYISIFLYFYLSIFLSFHLSIFASFYLSIYLSIYLSKSIYLSLSI